MNEPSLRNVVIQNPKKDYDVLGAVQKLKEFCAFIREVIAHFDENKRLQEEAEARESDLRHCIEMTDDLSPEEQHQLYIKLAEALRMRRNCKAENEVLKPIYDQVVDKNLLNRLSQIQGAIGTVKTTVANRAYACRTDVLDDFRIIERTEEKSETVDV